MKPLTIITAWLNTQVATADLRQLVFGRYARLSECVKQNPDGVQRVPHPCCGVGGSTAAWRCSTPRQCAGSLWWSNRGQHQHLIISKWFKSQNEACNQANIKKLGKKNCLSVNVFSKAFDSHFMYVLWAAGTENTQGFAWRFACTIYKVSFIHSLFYHDEKVVAI